jgi:hypothetical protein
MAYAWHAQLAKDEINILFFYAIEYPFLGDASRVSFMLPSIPRT